MPIYLKEIGFSVMMIGILEGVAEATAGISKGYFGKLSDIKQVRLPFVRLGYILSGISKPMIAFFQWPLWVLGARSLDRLGKGIRTGARDAILSDESTPENKGKVFSFHRSLDTFGAVLGPVFALVFLYFKPGSYKLLFFISFFPSMAGIALLWLVKEKKKQEVNVSAKGYSLLAFVRYLKESPSAYRKLFIGLVAFNLFNSSDMFILLMAKQVTHDDTSVLSIYIFYNLAYAIFSYPMGILADRVGLKNIFVLGLAFFAITYAGLAYNTNVYAYYVLIFIYGLYAAATEGISKAWISNIAAKKDTATAIGTYSAFSSIVTMFSSALAGVVWYKASPEAMFLMSAIGTVGVIIYFLFLHRNPHKYPEVAEAE